MSRTRKLPPCNATNIRVSNLSVGLPGIRGAPQQLYPHRLPVCLFVSITPLARIGRDENSRSGEATFGVAAIPRDEVDRGSSINVRRRIRRAPRRHIDYIRQPRYIPLRNTNSNWSFRSVIKKVIRVMLILQCMGGLQSLKIKSTNTYWFETYYMKHSLKT